MIGIVSVTEPPCTLSTTIAPKENILECNADENLTRTGSGTDTNIARTAR